MSQSAGAVHPLLDRGDLETPIAQERLDELRLLDLFVQLPPGWLRRWGARLLQMPRLGDTGTSTTADALLFVEMALCSVSDQPADSISETHVETPDLELDVQAPPASPSSGSEFSLISDFELMGGAAMERDSKAALLSPDDLSAVLEQLSLAQYAKEGSLGLITRLIELLSASVKIHSYSTQYKECVQSLSGRVS